MPRNRSTPEQLEAQKRRHEEKCFAWVRELLRRAVTWELEEEAELVNFDPSDRSWMEKGVCRDMEAGPIFYGPLREPTLKRQARLERARRICGQCPVQVTCRLYAKAHHMHGFWGGQDQTERYALGYPINEFNASNGDKLRRSILLEITGGQAVANTAATVGTTRESNGEGIMHSDEGFSTSEASA